MNINCIYHWFSGIIPSNLKLHVRFFYPFRSRNNIITQVQHFVIWDLLGILCAKNDILYLCTLGIGFSMPHGLASKFTVINNHVSVVLVFDVAETIWRVNWTANFDLIVDRESGSIGVSRRLALIYRKSINIESIFIIW